MRRRARKRARRAEPEGGLLAGVAADARLAEGAEGVRRLLRAVFRAGTISLRDLAREVGLPVPVVAAVRGELEGRGLLVRAASGISLSEAGQQAVRDGLGMASRRRFPRPVYPALEGDLLGVLERVEAVCHGRPEVDVRLDQSHATPDTALRRALYLFEHDALEGRDVLILGDDDLTSLAIGLAAEGLGVRVRRLVVLEFDARLVAYLQDAAAELGLALEVVAHDLRADLPARLAGGFDAFLTDPPYTLPGLALFVSRGVQALRPEVGKQGFLCFGNRTPAEAAEAVGTVAAMGLAPVEILPDFNRYVGAQVLAGVSQMVRTVATGDLRPGVQGAYEGPLYTAETRRAGR